MCIDVPGRKDTLEASFVDEHMNCIDESEEPTPSLALKPSEGLVEIGINGGIRPPRTEVDVMVRYG